MSENELINNLRNAVVEGLQDQALDFLKQAIDNSLDVKEILDQAIIKGAEEVGKLYEQKEYFLVDMMMAGDTIQECMNILNPLLEGTENSNKGKILIGTPEGDIHDIGKNIMVALLQGQGYKVKDIGVDVPPNKFVEEAKSFNPDVIGMSGLLTVTISKINETVSDLRKAQINSKIIIGGGIMSEETCKMIEADDWTKDGWKGVLKINELISNKEEN